MGVPKKALMISSNLDKNFIFHPNLSKFASKYIVNQDRAAQIGTFFINIAFRYISGEAYI